MLQRTCKVSEFRLEIMDFHFGIIVATPIYQFISENAGFKSSKQSECMREDEMEWVFSTVCYCEK